MSRSCNKLAFAISSATSIPLQSFRRVFDRLYVTDAVPLGFDLDAVRLHRNIAMRSLVALATCDFMYGDESCVRACTPHLALIPSASLPSAVLAGARTPGLLARFKSVVRANSDRATLAISEQPASPLLPGRVRVLAVSVDVLRTIADAAGVSLADPSPASTLAGFSADLNTYVASLPWKSHGSEPNWHRKDFDPGTLRFGSFRTVGAVRLSEYTHPSLEHRREHILIENNREATVNRDWGRYAALSSAGRHVLRYDADISVVMVPIGVPLPSMFARTLSLCSGYAPLQIDVPGAGRVDAFIRVPPSIAKVVADKLNQELILTPFGALPRGLHD